MLYYNTMAYKDQNESHYKDNESTNQQWRMSNILNDLKSRCKLLEAENKDLKETVHQYKTEYEVETAYLKNQVANERDRQMQWKNLYFDVHAELTDLKRQNQELRRINNNNNSNSNSNSSSSSSTTTSNNNSSSNSSSTNKNSSTTTVCNNISTTTITTVPNSDNNNNEDDGNNFAEDQSDNNNNNHIWQHNTNRPTHPADSGCQECENERKRQQESETELNRLPPHHPLKQGLPLMTSAFPLHVSSNEKLKSEDSRSISIYPSPRGHPQFPPFAHSQPLTSPKLPPAKLYECRACSICYDSEQKLLFHHMQVHNDYGNPPSRVRNPSGEYPDSMGQSTGDYYNCPECNQNFSNEDDYRRHLLIHMFKCRVCGIILESETSFVMHMKTHNETIPMFFCFLCDKQFSHVPQLTRHLLSHPDDMSFDCVQCGKHFTRKAHLTRHMSMHSKCRPYTCQDCGKKFAHKTHLRRHEIVHSGLRPHQCKVCQQSFSRKSSLSRHYFIHTTEKPFVCPVCEKGFNRKGRLRNHLNIHIRQGYPQLADYVIERRPITREFIEKINKVKNDENDNIDYSTMADIQNRNSFAVKIEPNDTDGGRDDDRHIHDSLTSYHGKEDSDDSSCSDTDEGEIDEAEAELSEEITFDQPPPSKSHSKKEQADITSKIEETDPHTENILPRVRVEQEPQQRPEPHEENLSDTSNPVYPRRVVPLYNTTSGIQLHPSEEMILYDRLVPRPHPGENMRVFEDSQQQRPNSRDGNC